MLNKLHGQQIGHLLLHNVQPRSSQQKGRSQLGKKAKILVKSSNTSKLSRSDIKGR